MATITASLERSLQNCSLNQTTRTRRGGGGGGGGLGRSSSSESPEIINHLQNHGRVRRPCKEVVHVVNSHASSSDDNSTFVELNSHVSLPYQWEQCLDLKTGEIYYINWDSGVKSTEDPRTTGTGYNGDYYSEDDDNEDDDDDDDDDEDDVEEEEEDSNCYDSEESTTTESSSCSSNFRSSRNQQQQLNPDSVLVVAGCKSCLMYYMVPKHVEDCPKCSGQLLHFAANNSSP